MSEIKPALTPEEWSLFGKSMEHDPATILAGLANRPDRRDALAALTLHGQPFGFTWDDVDTISHFASWVEKFGHPQTSSEKLQTIADRIAALLPPRGQTT